MKRFDYVPSDGDVALIRYPFQWYNPLSILALIIRTLCGSVTNHAFLIFNEYGILQVNEAVGKGVIKIPLFRKLKKRRKSQKIIIRRYSGMDFSRIQETKHRSNWALGLRYGFLDLLLFHLIYQFLILIDWVPKWYGRGAATGWRQPVCSEHCGWSFQLDKWWRMTPQMLEVHPELITVFEGTVEELVQHLSTLDPFFCHSYKYDTYINPIVNG